MPTYEYECRICREQYEQYHSIEDRYNSFHCGERSKMMILSPRMISLREAHNAPESRGLKSIRDKNGTKKWFPVRTEEQLKEFCKVSNEKAVERGEPEIEVYGDYISPNLNTSLRDEVERELNSPLPKTVNEQPITKQIAQEKASTVTIKGGSKSAGGLNREKIHYGEYGSYGEQGRRK